MLLRSQSGQLSQSRQYAGGSLHPTLGLVMVGSSDPDTASAESTVDGINMDTTTVPDFDREVHANCMVTANETTIISLGGDASGNGDKVSVFTLGKSEWEVSHILYQTFPKN